MRSETTTPHATNPAEPAPPMVDAAPSTHPSRTRDLVIAAVLIVAVLLLARLVSDVYLLNILVLTLLYAAASQAWNILGGYCGQISLGHALYFGVGAYAVSVLFVDFGISPWAGLLAGAVLAASLAVALGYLTFRMGGHYFTIATIVIAEAGLLIVHNMPALGAAMGIQWPFDASGWATLQFGREKVPYVFLALGLLAVTWLCTFMLENSRWGFWWRAVKDDVQAAESIGVEVLRSKMVAAALSAALTALAGGFYAAFVAYIDPDSVMSFRFSLLFALPAVLGGIGTLWGPVLGAAVLVPLTELTRSYAGGSGNGLDLMIYGGLITLVAIARPDGLLSLFRRRRSAS